MNSTVTATFTCEVPGNAIIGQEFAFTGRARLTSLHEEMIDVSGLQYEAYVPGRTSYEMLLYNVCLQA